MPYSPLNLTALQIGLESGGKQFGPDGKPLTSKKGALGVAQVMPETGPEAAKDAGLPWDPERYKHDREYNLRIGDAYQGKLKRRFAGDELAAVAAYNAGPTKVARLKEKHGADWAQHLPAETKHYLKVVKGVDVDKPDGSYYSRESFADGILNGLGAGELKPYVVAEPTAGEVATVEGPNQNKIGTTVDQDKVAAGVKQATDASANYTAFLQNAIAPIHNNSVAIVEKTKAIAQTKENLYNDFATREADLEAKMKPLQERRARLIARLEEMETMSPLDRKLKGLFNADWNRDVIEGKLSRVDKLIGLHNESYAELNALRAPIAALSVDAEGADVETLNAQSRSVLADANLLGQVVQATAENAKMPLMPVQLQVETQRLELTAKHNFLGTVTTEMVTKLANDAQASPDGTVTVQGMKFTTGELQDAARNAQSQDLTFNSLKNAYALSDLHTADALESNFIDHMTPDQIATALKDGGKYNGQQLSVTKLTGALAASKTNQESLVNTAIEATAPGQAEGLLRSLSTNLKFTRERATEMFGNVPGELGATANQLTAGIQAWQEGFNNANASGVGATYIARTLPQLQALQQGWDTQVGEVAKKWGGGNAALTAVADSYLRGNPLSGDAALKGLVVIARSGMPAGAKLEGPALAAIQAAQAVVSEWDNPSDAAAGMTPESLLAPKQGKKETDLLRRVQQAVTASYADSMTQELLTSLPDIARTVRDPHAPGKVHPFSRVSKEDFMMSVRHGDAEGYRVVGQDLGLNPQQTQKMFAGGVDSAEWQAVKKSKGLQNSQFADLMERLQAVQMTETLSALDASHSAQPGFSPAKAYVDLMNSTATLNKVDQVVNGYGRSNFGAFLASSSAGGGYREGWNNYAQGLAAAYTQLHSTELRERIKQSRGMLGDPFKRMTVVLAAAGLSPQESQVLAGAVKQTMKVPEVSREVLIGTRNPALVKALSTRSFDAITYAIRNGKFDDPVVERIRQKAAKNWDEMDAVVQRIAENQ